jgi:predicted Zn-dependent protease
MTAALLFALALASGPTTADEPADHALRQRVLAQEIERHQAELSLPDAPPLYHLRYHLLDVHQQQAQASFGSLLASESSPFVALGVEVRVGSPDFDNTGYGGWESGFGRLALPDRLTERALRQGCWRLTDNTYKDAVEQHARKAAAFTPPPDYPGDFQTEQLDPAVTLNATSAPQHGQPVAEGWAERVARAASAGFPTDGSLELGSAIVAAEQGSHILVDSEGTSLQLPHSELVVRLMAQARAEDGALLSDHRSWILRHDTLPTDEQLAAEAAAMAEELLAWTRAAPLEDEYVGPVIFEDQAAVELFRTLLVSQLEGTPPPVPFEARFGALGEGFSFADDGAGGGARLNRRVLPSGWSAVDRAAGDASDPAGFLIDAEGTTATKDVELVEDGIVRTLLMSRVPRKDIPTGSNGRARGSIGNRAAGRVARLEVAPGKRSSERKLQRRALELAAAYGHDHVIVVRRFQDDTVRAQDRSGASVFSFLGEEGTRLPVPLVLVRLYADGREEPLRGAVFAQVDRWVLRDIVAAGEQVQGRYLAPFEPGGVSFSPIVGMPTSLSVPEVLVEELELVPVSADPRSKPAVPAPSQP